jgi:hypothetical protein
MAMSGLKRLRSDQFSSINERPLNDYDNAAVLCCDGAGEAGAKQNFAVLEWSKQISNEIVSVVRTSGYATAVRLAEKFLNEMRHTSYIQRVQCMDGNLLDLATALYFSCRMGESKEGIINHQWSSERVTDEYETLLEELPTPLHDCMIQDTVLETLFSFTVNTIAWLELRKDYNKAEQIMTYYLKYIEGVLQKDGDNKQFIKTYKRYIRLAAGFGKYFATVDKWDGSLHPSTSVHIKRAGVPYSLLAQVYKPRYRLASVQGFFQFIARGSNIRRMGYSIAYSLCFMGLLIYLLN